MKEFVKRHFPDASYKVIQGEPAVEIVKYLKNRHQDELIVLGAYHRSMVSRWFKISMADTLMTELRTPLFIAHR
jgi:nucleotide-binding universal stress UspA family protein